MAMHCHPNSEHFSSFFSCLHSSATLAATPDDVPASTMSEGLRGGDITETSKAAHKPLSQFGTYTIMIAIIMTKVILCNK